MSSIDQLVDHAADLQREVDRQSTEILLLALSIVALAIGGTILGWQLWRK